MAVYIYYKEELLGRYDSPTKEILDRLISKSSEKTFLVRHYVDEEDLPKLISSAQKSRNLANIIMGFNRDFIPSPLRGSDPDRVLGTIKIGPDHIKYQPLALNHFITEENKDVYFSSPVTVFTSETYEDIITEYAKSGIKCMLPDGWTKSCDPKRKYRVVPSYALLMQAGIRVTNGPEK